MNTRYSPYKKPHKITEEYPKILEKLVKNILKLFNKIPKYEKYAVLSIVADIISKKELRKNGFIFSNTMYSNAKRKRNEYEIEDRQIVLPKSKKPKGDDIKQLILNKLQDNSEETCKSHRDQPVFNLKQSKRSIYKELIKDNTELKLSISTFYKLCPKNFKYCKKKTDMCNICVNGQKLEKKVGENSDDVRIKYYRQHSELNKDQKRLFREKIQGLEPNECIVIMDFKQSFKVGGGPVEKCQDFYNKSQVSCLGFCVITKESLNVKRRYYNYLSDVIKRDSYFVKNCLKNLHEQYLSNFSNVHFWSDNAGHFRSQELKNYILRELPAKSLITSLNYFVEYHGKTELDGHFGLLQRVLNNFERLNEVNTIYDILVCFSMYFLDADTDAWFEIYEDARREDLIENLKIEGHMNYMSYFSDAENIYGKSVSTLDLSSYRPLEHTVYFSKDARVTKYASRINPNKVWKVSPVQLGIMDNRVALKT